MTAGRLSFENGVQIAFSSLGHEQMTLAGSSPLPNIPDRNRVRRVVIRPIDGDIYFTDDGSTPSTSHGMLILNKEVFVYDGRDLDAVRLINATTTTDVRIIYYGT